MDHDYMAKKSSSGTRVEETNLNFGKHSKERQPRERRKTGTEGKWNVKNSLTWFMLLLPSIPFLVSVLNDAGSTFASWICWGGCHLWQQYKHSKIATTLVLESLELERFSSHTKCSPLLRLRHYLWRLSIVGMFIFCHSLQFNANKSKRIGGNENLESWINLVLIEYFLKAALTYLSRKIRIEA